MIKACRFRKLTLHDIVTSKHPSGAPYGVILDHSEILHAPSRSISSSGLHAHDEQVVNGRHDGLDDDSAGGSEGSTCMPTAVQVERPSDGIRNETYPWDPSGFEVHLSISHDGDYAMATCLMPTEQR